MLTKKQIDKFVASLNQVDAELKDMCCDPSDPPISFELPDFSKGPVPNVVIPSDFEDLIGPPIPTIKTTGDRIQDGGTSYQIGTDEEFQKMVDGLSSAQTETEIPNELHIKGFRHASSWEDVSKRANSTRHREHMEQVIGKFMKKAFPNTNLMIPEINAAVDRLVDSSVRFVEKAWVH
jgi:hypothetical protein